MEFELRVDLRQLSLFARLGIHRTLASLPSNLLIELYYANRPEMGKHCGDAVRSTAVEEIIRLPAST